LRRRRFRVPCDLSGISNGSGAGRSRRVSVESRHFGHAGGLRVICQARVWPIACKSRQLSALAMMVHAGGRFRGGCKMRRQDFTKAVGGAGVWPFTTQAQQRERPPDEIYELDLRPRAATNEPITERHDRFMRAMARYAPPWGLKGLEIPPAREVAPGDLSAVVRLRGLSPMGEMSYVHYPF